VEVAVLALAAAGVLCGAALMMLLAATLGV
jgi:hypothetical protein